MSADPSRAHASRGIRTPWPTTRQAVWAPVCALLAALLVALAPEQPRWNDGLNDLLVRVVVPPPRLDGLLIVDIDDSSLADLLPLLGPWPYGRDVHALAVDFLREAGARVIGIDIVFNDARPGDTALRAAIARPGAPVVLAAAGLRQVVEAEQSQAVPLGVAFDFKPEAPPLMRWPAVTAPGAALLVDPLRAVPPDGLPVAAPRLPLGLITTPLSDDGKLRRLPLLHGVQGQVLPAFSLAMHLMAGADSPLRYDAQRRTLHDGSQQWPVDAQGMAALRFPSAGAVFTRVRYSELANAMLGRSDGSTLRALVRDRAVFIGSTAFFGDGVMTAEGQVHGTELLAGAYAALRDGGVLRPAAWAWDMALLALALLPALLAWRGGPAAARQPPTVVPLPASGMASGAASIAHGVGLGAQGAVAPGPTLGRDLLRMVLALVAVLALAAGLLASRQQLVSLAAPLAALLAGAVALAWSHHRWMARQHQRLAYERTVAEAANRAKTEFLAGVSHEIRTPMNALLGVAELLADTPLTDEQRRHVAVFQRAGETLFSLINDLLDLAKIEAGKIELRHEVFSVQGLVDEQVALLRPRAAEKGWLLACELAADLPPWVLGDRQRLGQALLNLLGNAIKFTRDGQVRLSVVVQTTPTLVFAVQDTGVGIAESKLEDIFQPFIQADGGLARSYGGTGLGLSITRSLARLMGGEVTVRSTPGKGTRFELSARLPAADGPPAAAALSGPAALFAALPDVAVVPLHILLADDNAANVYIVQAMLRADGHPIDVVGDGLLAVERLRSTSYDLVLMDAQMPGMDGYTATREIRRIEARMGRSPVPVIMVSAHAYADDIERSRSAGCTEHLSKPLSRRALRDAIARHRPAQSAAPAVVDIVLEPPTPAPALQAETPPRWFGQIRASGLVDADASLQRLDGNLMLYHSVLDHAAMFLTTWSRSFRAACAEGNRAQAMRLSHDLKGIAATIGAATLAGEAQAYDDQLRRGLPAGDGPPLDRVELALRPVLVLLANTLR